MPPRIIQISFGDGYAGSAGIAILSCKLLSSTNYDVILFVSKDSLTETRAIEKGITVQAFDTSKNFRIIYQEINQAFQKQKPQVVISHHSLDRKIAMKLKRKSGIDFLNIAYRHNVTKSAPVIGAFLYNRYFNILIACSKGVGNSLLGSGIKRNKIEVIYNGINIPGNIDYITGEHVIAKYQLEDKIILGLSTWFHKERKGFDMLFETFSKLKDKYVLLLVGIPSKDQKDVLEYAKEYKIGEERIVMPGYVENIWEYYKAMDIFLLPSRSEGFSLALLEAAAAKLPIIASDIPGTNEFIVNGENGLLFDLRNFGEMLNGILRLSKDKEYAGKLAMSAHKIVNENFTQKIYIDKLNKLLKQSLSKTGLPEG